MRRTFSPETLRHDIYAIAQFLRVFWRKPLLAIQREPNWDFQRSLVFLVLFSVVSAVLTGILQASVGHALVSMFVLPIMTVGAAAIVTFLLTHAVRFIHERHLDLEPLFQAVAMSILPFLIFRIFRSFAPPVTLIGLAATCALLIVGLTDRFQLPRKSIVKIISIFFVVYLVYWGVDVVRKSNFRQMAGQNISEESIKVLDQEFKPSE